MKILTPRVLKTLTIALLGSASLLPVLASAETVRPNMPEMAAADPAKPSPPAPAAPPLTVKPSSAGHDTAADAARDKAMEARRNDRIAFMEARLAALHVGLQLTPEQQPLWGSVEGALRDLATARRAMRHAAHEAGAGTTDPAGRLKQRGERLVAMGQAIGKLADATGPLLGALTPDQKNRLPMLLHGVGPHRLVKQAFGAPDDRMRGEMGRGGRGEMGRDEGGRGDGGRGSWRHPHLADRDAMGGPDGDGRDRQGWDGGWRHRFHHWDRQGRAEDGRADEGRSGDDRYGRDRFDGGPSHGHWHGSDDRIGG